MTRWAERLSECSHEERLLHFGERESETLMTAPNAQGSRISAAPQRGEEALYGREERAWERSSERGELLV
jgi:hypothetical protein